MKQALVAALTSTLAFTAASLEAQAGCVSHSIACGQTLSSSLSADDCETARGKFYDAYFFVGHNQQQITADLSSSDFDSFLQLYDPIARKVAEDDDGAPGLGKDARIVYTLDEHSSKWSLLVTSYSPGSTGAYTLSLACTGGQSPPRPGSGWFDDPQYPDFRFRVEIDGREARREEDCQPDTVCVSGALPGRSEIFLRILGPRPNGFLWPTIVRFTPSEVRVEIFQHSSARTKTYVLDAVAPGTTDLPGFQDRMAFLP